MGRRIAIVGNGDLGGFSPSGIRADCVIRFNDCRSAGEIDPRTDIVAVCNTGRPAKAMVEGGWRRNVAVLNAGEIWCVRAPERYETMRGELMETHPELDDYCDDYSAGFAAFAQESGKGFKILPASLHRDLEEQLARLDAEDFVSPSSGALALAEVLENFAESDDEVIVAGFSHEGWDLHPWAAERRWMETFIAAGRIQRAEEFYDKNTYREFKAHAI